MSDEIADTLLPKASVRDNDYKIQTAEALEEAARKLRNADLSIKNEDVRHILHDVELQVNTLKTNAGAQFHKIEADYHKKVEPVENIIKDHPIPSVLIAAGLGVLIGMLIFKSRD